MNKLMESVNNESTPIQTLLLFITLTTVIPISLSLLYTDWVMSMAFYKETVDKAPLHVVVICWFGVLLFNGLTILIWRKQWSLKGMWNK